MSDLTFAEAIHLAETLRNHYAAFQRLGDLLDLATSGLAQAESRRKDIETLGEQVVQLQRQRQDAEEALVNARAAIDPLTSHLQDLHRQRQELLTHIQELQTSVANREAELLQMTQTGSLRREQLETAHVDRTAVLHVDMTTRRHELQTELTQLGAARDALQSDIEAKRAELERLSKSLSQGKQIINQMRSSMGGKT